MPTALVTGASSGIGLELARSFARRDHDLVLTARSEEPLRDLAAELRAHHGVRVDVVTADLATAEGPEDLLDALRARDIAVDVLVNNAGIATYGRFDRIGWPDDRDLLALDIVALTRLSKALLPGMLQRGHGGILNVASTAAFQAGPRMATYYAAKAYVLHLTEAIAEESKGTGVTVTALCPGPTRTAFQRRAGMEDARLVRDGAALTVDAARVAEAGVRAFHRGQRVHVPGLRNRIGSLLPRLVPRRWAAWAIGRVHESVGDAGRRG